MYMPSQLGIVGKDGVTADLAIVRQMHIGHDPVVIAQTGHPCIAGRTDIKGAKLSDGIAVSNH
jgi:hypothetical protein